MFKDFLIRKMLKAQMKGVPEAEQERLIKLVTENPELFQKIGEEVQTRIKQGEDQMKATMAVMKLHEEELKRINNK
jgi:hypothetical protein